MTVNADEIVVNAFTDRSRVQPWGLFGGDPGSCGAFLVKRGGEGEWQYFTEAFGTPSDTKFSNVRLRRGDQVLLRTPSGAGYGDPLERSLELVAEDVREGFVSAGQAAERYGVVLDGSGDGRRGGDAARGGEADDAVDHPQRALAPHRRALLRRHGPAPAAPLLERSSTTGGPTTSWTSTARRSCATTSPPRTATRGGTPSTSSRGGA